MSHHVHDFFPSSAEVAWWLTAWLRGHESTDSLLEVVAPVDAAGGTVLDLLARLRREEVDGAGLALPVPGDPTGLGGPAGFNVAALEVGEAVIVGSIGLVPEPTGAGWHLFPANRRQVPDLHEATTILRRTLVAAADGLAALDVTRWRPEVADLLLDLRHLPDVAAPHGIPPECEELAARGLLARTVAIIALEDDGGAYSASEIDARRALLAPLEAASRRALVAACSPAAWPTREARR